MKGTMRRVKPDDSSETALPPLRKELSTLAGAFALMLFADFLLWPAQPGLSWGLFTVALGLATVMKSPRPIWNRRLAALFVLLLLTACQSAVEISFSNVLVSLVLSIALVGEASYRSLLPGWERTSEALWALVKVPGRWLWVSRVLARLEWSNGGILGKAMRCVTVGLPALLLGLLFAVLLGQGNAIFHSWTAAAFATLWRWLAELDLSPAHLLFYGLLGTFSLWVLRPAPPAPVQRLWVRPIPQLPVPNPSVAFWRSVAILVVLNALFFFVNTIDAFYLWWHGSLPAGVSASQYVHEGVNSLIAVVLLSALVMATLFQQGEGIGQNRPLKRLGYFWIGQNFILIASVLLRLVRYIQDYHLTEARVYAIAFVLLVAVGFVLLAQHIARGGSLNRLLLSNTVATLALFFLMQFPDVAGWVASYNVTQWERNARKRLDVAYLSRLGPPAWPALARVANSDREKRAAEAKKLLQAAREAQAEHRATRNWRSWQSRR